MLAVASKSFSVPSETFIRAHAQLLAPGNTVLISGEPEGEWSGGMPTLSSVNLGGESARADCQNAGLAALLNPKALNRRRRGVMGPASGRRVLDFLRDHDVDTVLVEYGPVAVKLLDVMAASQSRFFVHFHGNDASAMLRHKKYVQRYRELHERVAGAIAPSRYVAQALTAFGFPDDKVHVNPCGVDVSAFVPGTPTPGKLLMVGRLVEKKAPHLSIQAFGRVADRFPTATLDVVGDGQKMETCKAIVAELDLTERVTFHGAVPLDTVRALMKEADIFLQHSVTAPDGDIEGLPVAILEAMASAVPVVSTYHSGIPEAVEDGVSGLLVKEHDVDGMAEALASLLSNPETRATMAQNGRRVAQKRFSLEVTIANLRHVLGVEF